MIARALAMLTLLSANASAQIPTLPKPRDTVPASLTTLIGVARGVNGTPLVGAEVRLFVADSLTDRTQTDGEGRFSTKGVLSAKAKLSVRQAGFVSRDVELFFPRDSTRVLIVELEPASNMTAIAAEDSIAEASWLREFYERKRSNSLGHFLTRREIANRQLRFLSEALRTIPGVTVSTSREGPGFVIRVRGCRYGPVVWLDRGRIRSEELDAVVRIDEVAALEVYTSPAGVPAQYTDRSNVGCGTIIVWSVQ